MKNDYLIDFISLVIAKDKNVSHFFSIAYMSSRNHCLTPFLLLTRSVGPRLALLMVRFDWIVVEGNTAL